MGNNKIRISESELQNIIMHEVKTVFGEEAVFPSDRFKRFKSKETLVLESALLTEGLVRTYPFEWVERYLKRNANSDFRYMATTEKEKKFTMSLKKGSKSIEPLKHAMEAFGYHCSYETDNGFIEGHMMQFEPKFDEYTKGSEFPFPKDKVAFYHVAPHRFRNKILKNGLVPRSNNRMFKYPDRVYMLFAPDGVDAAYEMARMLYSADKNERNDGTYDIFGITLDGIGDVKFYRDWNVDHTRAYYTHENIPPKNIEYIESFSVNK